MSYVGISVVLTMMFFMLINSQLMLCSHALHVRLECAVGDKTSGKSLSVCVNGWQKHDLQTKVQWLALWV